MFKLSPLFVLLLFPVYLFSQDLPGKLNSGRQNEAGPGLLNGKEYYPYFQRSKRKPLLFMERERTSSVRIDGITHNAVLHYDTYTGEVIYSVSYGADLSTGMISLNKDIIKSFTLNFTDDTLIFERFSGTGLDDAYYEVVWPGPTTFLIHHRSMVFEKDGIDEYYYRPLRYVLKNGEYHRVKSAGKFTDLFGDDSELIKELVRKYRVNFKNPDKENIAGMLREYDKRQTIPGR